MIGIQPDDPDPYLLTSRDGEVAVVTLNRPAKLNAWTQADRAALTRLLRALEADDGVRAVVLTGAGDGWCAGQDLAETAAFDPADPAVARDWLDNCESLYDAVRSISKPTVAALNGVAAGSGFQVALLTDVRVAHAGVLMGQPEVRHGIPSITGTWVIREHLGLSRTSELVLSGRLMDAAEARDAGLVHHLVAAGDLMPTALRVARELSEQPRDAVARTKSWLRQLTEPGYRRAFEAARAEHGAAFAGGGPQHGMRAFLGRSS
ncbi:enoyl-CoA hydratase [Phytohabitans flavus]|uniref:Enoyl-CoA hydratase n=1 Tax=Phytohabitans flavus TaxID=1076124 RepID=A0A6F8XN79_9ACTN|nr:enoyl-CoA hydratase/isomerase family protein [Phytohabitans flavus]BCB75273.1 enoyl-CoA hydratase [Phytohabitans flavus]